MKKITLNLAGKFLLLMMLLSASISAYAAENDLGALQINTVYNCPSFSYVKGSFTPETTGAFKINYSSSDRFSIYTDAEMTVPYENGGEWAYASETIQGMNSMGYENWNFEAGTTYYFGGSAGSGLFIMNSNAQFVITATTNEILVSSVTPEENSPISTGSTAQIDVAFNCNVTVESATIQVADYTETLAFSDAPDSRVRIYGNTVSVILKEMLQSLYDLETIKGGESIIVTLNNICRSSDNSIIYGEDGKLTLNFVVAEKPASLVSSINTPDQMPSVKTFYFNDDTSGSISLTFNRELLNNPNDLPIAVWGVGNKESETGDYYEEIIQCVVDGCTLTINLQGKLRNTSTMELLTDYTTVQLDVQNVKSADGQYVYSEGSGKLGSFNYLYNLVNVETEVVAEFTPSKGEIYEGEELEIWIMGDSDLRYDGISFLYDDKEMVVTEFNKIVDPEEEKASIITLLMPKLEGVESSTEVVVMLKDVKAADGLDHSKDVKATFTYKVKESDEILEGLPVSISPADGSTVKELQIITLEFSVEDYPNTMSYDGNYTPVLYNEAGEEVATGHYGYADAATYMSLYISFDEAITAEGTYTLVIPEGGITEYSFGIESPRICPELKLTYTIGTAEPQYTVTASPAPGTEMAVEEINVFTVTFEDVKKIDFSTEAWHGYVLRVDEKGNTLEEFPATCEMISDVAYTVTMDREATEFGIYRLVIPEAAVIVNDNNGVSGPNKEVTFDYNVTYSSVESIATEASEFNVYNINGVCVLKNAKAEDLKLLQNGVYIVNGQKVIIR